MPAAEKTLSVPPAILDDGKSGRQSVSLKPVNGFAPDSKLKVISVKPDPKPALPEKAAAKKPDAKAKPEPKAEAKPDVKAKPDTRAEPKAAADVKTEAKARSETKTKTN